MKAKQAYERAKDEAGQVLVLGLFVVVGLFMVAMTVANVGMMVAEKIHLQDTVDASAYSAAVVEARYMNLSAYINRAMVANYDSMAFNTALWAVSDATDHGVAVIVALLYQIDAVLIAFPLTTAIGVDLDSFIDVLKSAHSGLHTINHTLDDLFAQDDDAQDMNQYLEIYNIDILTMYQGLLFAALQSSRHQVQQEVARKMDSDVVTTSVLGLGAEAVSAEELVKAVDFVIRDPDARSAPFNLMNNAFSRITGPAEDNDDYPLLLGAVTEASLDRFAAGRTRDGDNDGLRAFLGLQNLIPSADTLETIVDVACEIATLGFGDCDSEISLTIGGAMRDGFENKASETHVPFIARQRMRETNFFGLEFKMSGFPLSGPLSSMLGSKGHTSGEKHNDIGNVANTTFGIGEDLDFDRAFETVQSQGFCAVGLPVPTCGLNSMNILEASLMIAPPLFPPLVVDDHWDGSFSDIEPVNSYELIPPGLGVVEVVEYVAEVAAEGTEDGVPKYDWQVDLDNVGFPHFTYPTEGAVRRPNASSGGGGDKNILQGPSIAVVGVKAQDKIRGLQGLGIGNPYSMTAISRAQVYYLRNPNRPDELPSLFNPHWVARLAPIDSEDSPPLLSSGLPYVGSLGIPIKPTH